MGLGAPAAAPSSPVDVSWPQGLLELALMPRNLQQCKLQINLMSDAVLETHAASTKFIHAPS